MPEMFGLLNYAVFLLTMAGIYGVMVLGLNLQWGLTGLLNIGVAGFFAIGAYTSSILTTAETAKHLGGYGMPFVVGLLGAMAASALIGWAVGRICIRLRSDYLAIATIGIAEILRLILKNEEWATNGARGISNIPRPFESLGGLGATVGYLIVVLICVAIAYWLLELGQRSPWGRVMRAIRDNEDAARAAGKNVERFRVEAFVIGAAFMGLGGALSAHFFKFVGPEATDPLLVTFLVWVMLIAGGSGNNRGALLGALVVWTLWSATELVTSQFSGELAVRAPFIRVFLIGLLLQFVLQYFAGGLIPEKRKARQPGKPRTEDTSS